VETVGQDQLTQLQFVTTGLAHWNVDLRNRQWSTLSLEVRIKCRSGWAARPLLCFTRQITRLGPIEEGLIPLVGRRTCNIANELWLVRSGRAGNCNDNQDANRGEENRFPALHVSLSMDHRPRTAALRNRKTRVG
jgi:hypothetical protein